MPAEASWHRLVGWFVPFLAVAVRGQVCPSTYRVLSGDYLCNITIYYGLTSDSILTANPGVLLNNTKDSLQSGVNLSLPCPQSPGCPTWTYAARNGESYYSISKTFGVAFDQLRIANNISIADPDCCNITCGDSIVVPCTAGRPSYGPSAAPRAAPSGAPMLLPSAAPRGVPVRAPAAPPAAAPRPAPSGAPASSPTRAPSPAPGNSTSPPPPNFMPLKFQFWVPNMTANQVSSPHTDSDYVNTFCKVDGVDSSTSPQISGELDMHSGQTRNRWNGCQAIVTRADSVVTMGFSIVNSGASSRLDNIFSNVTNLTSSALSAAGQSVWNPVAQQAGNLLQNLFPDCDGLVAADGLYFKASNFSDFKQYQNGLFNRGYNASHCGEDSKYSVTFVAVLVGPA